MRGKEVRKKSGANWPACFLRPPLTSHCGGVLLFQALFCLAATSLTLCDYLFPGQGERRWESGIERRERKRLVSTVMADERERDRFCLVAHLSPISFFFPFSLCYSSNPPMLIFSFIVLHISLFHSLFFPQRVFNSLKYNCAAQFCWVCCLLS